MKALLKKERKTGLWLEVVPKPQVGIDDVLIRVDRTGALAGRPGTGARGPAKQDRQEACPTHH